ncbi:MAG: hypothetical protein EPO16_07175 [Dehalococcoidia bacterium]|nr:MAG: hypothetical protein EPO16_07175 [Dehalococcoidia bacterium]
MKAKGIRVGGLIGLTVAAVLLGAVGLRPGVVHAADATIGAGSNPNRFAPNTQTVNVGDKVTFVWTSSGASGHDATATSGGFPKLTLTQATPNGTWTMTTPGTYYFYCSIHSPATNATEDHVKANDAMVGKIVVVASGAPAPAPGPALAVPAAAPAPAKTGSAGLVGRPGDMGIAIALGALALLSIAAARFVTRRER